MEQNKPIHLDHLDFHARADEIIKGPSDVIQSIPHDDIHALVQELRKYQIKLEKRNDQLFENQSVLEASRDKYLNLYDLAPIGYFAIDDKNHIIDVNLKGAEILGVDRQSLLSVNMHQFIHDNSLAAYNQHRQKVLETGQLQTCELQLIHQHGMPFYVQLQSIREHDQTHRFNQFRTVMIDITSKKISEQLLFIQRDLAVTLSGMSDMKQALFEILDTTLKIDGIDCGSVFLLNKESGELWMAVHRGIPLDNVKTKEHFNANETLSKIVREGKPVYRENLVDEGEKFVGLKALAVIPVLHENEVVAALNLASLSQNEIPDMTRSAVESIASRIGSIIVRMRAEQILEENQKNLQTLFDTLDDFLFILNDSGQIFQYNPPVKDRLGFTEYELKHMHFSDLFLKNDQNEARSILKNAQAGHFSSFNAPLNPKFKKLIPAETRVNVGFWGEQRVFFCVTRDMTERVKLEDIWKKFEFIANSSREFMSLIDKNYIYEAANESYCNAHNKKMIDIINRSVEEIWGERNFYNIIKSHLDECFTGIEVKYEAWFEFTGSDERYFDVRYYPYIDKNNVVTHIVVVSRDITERKKSEEKLQDAHDKLELRVEERTRELKEINDQLRHEIVERKQAENALKISQNNLKRAKEEAEAANRAKSVFLANMSHEIRTPISGIIGATEMLMNTNLNREQIDLLEMMRTSAKSLLKIINDVLDFSKIEAGKMELNKVDFNLNKTIKEIMDLFSLQAQKKGLQLNTKIMSDVPQMVNGVPDRLGQVLRNLVSNAIKFTNQGHVDVTVRNTSGPTYPIQLLFSVNDTGPGIPEDQQHLLFKSFSQLDQSYAKKYCGTGLGLAISKRFIELMGGTIWVESKENQGSMFCFTLPVEQATTHQLQMNDEEKEIQSLDMPPLSILLAEDNLLNQKFVSHLLMSDGHQIFTVINGKEVLTVLTQMHFDLILMDVQMPEMDGVETTRIIRSSDGKYYPTNIPIIALTAYAMKGDKERFLKAGMNEYITKPVNYNALKNAIKKVFYKHERQVVEKSILFSKDSKLKTLDYDAALRQTNDNQALVLELFSMFYNDIPTILSDLETAIIQKNKNQIDNLSHRLKSTSGTIGAQISYRIAERIENNARLGKLTGMDQLFEELKTELNQLKVAIKSHLEEHHYDQKTHS